MIQPRQAGPPRQPTGQSLSKHDVPEWFRDAKFGSYGSSQLICNKGRGADFQVRREKRPQTAGWETCPTLHFFPDEPYTHSGPVTMDAENGRYAAELDRYAVSTD